MDIACGKLIVTLTGAGMLLSSTISLGFDFEISRSKTIDSDQYNHVLINSGRVYVDGELQENAECDDIFSKVDSDQTKQVNVVEIIDSTISDGEIRKKKSADNIELRIHSVKDALHRNPFVDNGPVLPIGVVASEKTKEIHNNVTITDSIISTESGSMTGVTAKGSKRSYRRLKISNKVHIENSNSD